MQCLLEKKESGERNVVEGKFGEGKRIYGLGKIRTKLKETSETSIHLTFLVMNIERRLRVFLLPILGACETRRFLFETKKKELLSAA
jgi:transposase, IS5 family